MSEIVEKLQSDLLYVEEVAALMRKSVATVRWMEATGTGPKSGKLGRRRVWKRDVVEAFIEAAFSTD